MSPDFEMVINFCWSIMFLVPLFHKYNCLREMESFYLPSYVFFVGIIYNWESLIYNLEKVEMIVYSHTRSLDLNQVMI